MGRRLLFALIAFVAGALPAQQRDRYTLYRMDNDKPFRIQEGRYITMEVEPSKCAGWDVREQSVEGDLLLVDERSVTIMLRSEHAYCYHEDSTFTWDRSDCPDGGTLTIPNERILAITRENPAGNAFQGVMGLSLFSAVLVAPLASIKWFNGWNFNAKTYTTIAKGSLIAFGASLPLAVALGGERRLVPRPRVR